MLDKLFGKRKATKRAGETWHRWILSKARDPEPYRAGWVEDTLEGRFQMVTLVTTLVLRTLRERGPEGKARADAVYRAVFSGFDHALREEGVGDASIARRMRGLGEEFFGLARRVDAAFAAEDPNPELSDAIVQNGICSPEASENLAGWVVETQAELSDAIEAPDFLPD